MSTFIAELHNIAQHCENGAVLSDMLRDRLVCGISDEAVQSHLLREPDLTFDQALEIALAAEAAEKDSRRPSDKEPVQAMQAQEKDTPAPSVVNRVGQHKSTHPARSEHSGDRGCHRCGGKHHPAQCTFKGYECHYCKKKVHLAKVCRKKAKDQDKPEQAHVISKTATEDEGEYTMFHVSTGSSKPFKPMVKVNGIPLTMEIDTGASVSII